jgi:hypothetical protein
MNPYTAIPEFVMKVLACIAIVAALLVLELLTGWRDIWHWLSCWHRRRPGFVNPVNAFLDFFRHP